MENVIKQINQIKQRVDNGVIVTVNGTEHHLSKQLQNILEQAVNFAHSCTKLPCENCGENKELKYCEKCYNTAFDTENQ